MVERIPQHRHCQSCGRAFTGSGRFCSTGCQEGKEVEIKGKKRQLMTIYGLAVAVLLIALVVGL